MTRLNKPVGFYLLLWPTVLGFLMSIHLLSSAVHSAWLTQPPSNFASLLGWVFWVFVLGVVLMRSAGCAINDWADRDFDAKVARTNNRPLACGAIKPWIALAVALILSMVALLMALGLMIRLGDFSLLFWCLPAVFLAASYPFFKRFFALPQAYLGVAFGFGIPMVAQVILREVPWPLWGLFIANLLWTIAYDTQYALMDYEDDVKLGTIHTSAITFKKWCGDRFWLLIALLHFLTLAIWSFLAWSLALGIGFWLGWSIAVFLAVLQIYWVQSFRPERAFRAFLWAHWQGAALCAGWALDWLYTLNGVV